VTNENASQTPKQNFLNQLRNCAREISGGMASTMNVAFLAPAIAGPIGAIVCGIIAPALGFPAAADVAVPSAVVGMLSAAAVAFAIDRIPVEAEKAVIARHRLGRAIGLFLPYAVALGTGSLTALVEYPHAAALTSSNAHAPHPAIKRSPHILSPAS